MWKEQLILWGPPFMVCWWGPEQCFVEIIFTAETGSSWAVWPGPWESQECPPQQRGAVPIPSMHRNGSCPFWTSQVVSSWPWCVPPMCLLISAGLINAQGQLSVHPQTPLFNSLLCSSVFWLSALRLLYLSSVCSTRVFSRVCLGLPPCTLPGQGIRMQAGQVTGLPLSQPMVRDLCLFLHDVLSFESHCFSYATFVQFLVVSGVTLNPIPVPPSCPPAGRSLGHASVSWVPGF